MYVNDSSQLHWQRFYCRERLFFLPIAWGDEPSELSAFGLGMDVVELRFTHEALLAVAQKAAAMKTVARGLRAILEMVMPDVMYRVPSLPEVQGCLIGEEVIMKDAEPLFFYWKKAAHS